MTDEILTRINLSEESPFRPLALAPDLAMLDTQGLTFQVLQDWFGDAVAEPELTAEGVSFHVQNGGQRQTIAEKALATTADLEGPLAREYGQLKKFLFAARPVRPREQLIFSRVQLPIGNDDGSLYRVRCHGGHPRLIWCWGFQRCFSDVPARLCSKRECSQLFLQPDKSVKYCSCCAESLTADRNTSSVRSEFSLGATAAALILGSLTAATFCLPVGTGIAGHHQTAGDSEQSIDEHPGKMAIREPADFPERTAAADQLTGISEGAERQNSDVPGEVESVARPDPAATVRKGNPADAIERPGTQFPVVSAPGEVAEPNQSEPTAASSRPGLDWLSDYRTAYRRAFAEHARLAMLFVEPAAGSGVRDALAGNEMDVLLKPFVRVELPVDATVDGTSERLLAHRSFRHLGGKPGLVIVEFSDPRDPLFGQVISALPLPDNGQFSPQILKQLLALPGGSIGQRSLLLAIRAAFPSIEPNFSLSESAPHPVLNSVALRHARLMAESGRDDPVAQEKFRETVRRTFGDTVRRRELMFATSQPVSIQTAAAQAVEYWNRQPGGLKAGDLPVIAYGLDLFQSPASGRWFASVSVVQ